MFNHPNITKNATGVTLIELMIAITISLALMLGVGAIFNNSKRSYLVQEEFARLQENARFAIKFLVRDIRMAGFVGCAWNNNLNYENFLDPDGDGYDEAMAEFRVGMFGFDAEDTGATQSVSLPSSNSTWRYYDSGAGAAADATLPTILSSALTSHSNGSDILVIRHAEGSGIKLSGNKDSNHFSIADEGEDVTTIAGRECHAPNNICNGDFLLITDCEKSRLIQLTDLDRPGGQNEVQLHHGPGGTGHSNNPNAVTPGNHSDYVSWGGSSGSEHHFEPGDTEIFRAATYAYFISTGANGQPALFRMELRPGAVAQELIENVENMQVLYGIDTEKTAADQTGDGVANRFVSADQVNADIDNVVSARISFLLSTPQEINKSTTVAPSAKTLTLLGATSATGGINVTANADWRMRKVFTTTVKLRNKGLQAP